MGKIYNAAIIGLGFVGAGDQVSGDALGQQVANLDGTHAAAFAAHPRISLAGGSSRDSGRRKRFEDRYGVTTYADWRRLIADTRLDIVSVATYTPVHKEITIACAEAGIPVIYCEKPIASTIGDAEAMVAACREAGSLLVINHNRRFSPSYRKLKELLAGGLIGRITDIHLHWGRGRLGNVGTHVFDAVRMLTGQEVTAVSGTLDTSARPDCRGSEFTDPGGWGAMRLADGTVATVSAPDYGAHPVSIDVYGEDGYVAVCGRQISVALYGVQPQKSWAELSGISSENSGDTSMDIAVSEIVDFLDSGRLFPYAAEEAVKALEVVAAFHASHRRNAAWVELPLGGEDREIPINSG